MLLAALAVGAALVAALTGVGSGPARAVGQPAVAVSPHPAAAVSSHVVIVGISGLRWSDVSASATPALWAVAGAGSAGSLVDFAVGPDTCPGDAWLTLNGGDRAQVPHGGGGGCAALPVVTAGRSGAGVPGPARVAAMPSLVLFNRTLKYGPRWGLLASAAGAGNCATAVGPGAALALAGPGGAVGSYLPGVAGVSRAVLARCPLTVVDPGSLPAGPGAARGAALRHADAAVAALTAELPAGATLLVAGLGSATLPPHLQVVMVRGPGYRAGLLGAASTRQPGMVVLTDLTPTVLGWRGRGRPAGLPGAAVTAAARGPLSSACGWPQFGAKAGGTIALVPCALLLLLTIAGTSITARRAAVVLGTGVALFAAFALINYLIPATGTSDIGAFAGNLVHGHAGSLLTRKLTSMLGSIGLSPAVLPIIILVGLILLRPSWFAVKALPRGYAAEPLLAMTLAMMWLVCVLGWFADDSGIAVPGAALPLALPLGIALLAGIPLTTEEAASRGPAVTGSSLTSFPP